MNLLHFKNRFSKNIPFDNLIIPECTGYMKALEDVLTYLTAKTENNPAKRMIDAADLAESIGETNKELKDFSNYCAAQFLGEDKTVFH